MRKSQRHEAVSKRVKGNNILDMKDALLMHAQFAPDGSEAPSKTVSWMKYLILWLLIVVVLISIAIFVIHPYKRAERIAGDMLTRYAPAGTTVSEISVAFPLNVVFTNLNVPIQVQDRRRQLTVKEISGRVAILPLLQGMVEAGMNADFFGGTLWLDLKAQNPAKNKPVNPSFFSFDARARAMDIAQVCTFFGSSVLVSGLCDADAEGEMDERDPATLKGQALLIGENVGIPPLLIKTLILPENTDVRFTARLAAKNGKLLVEKFRLDGSAYKLTGDGVVTISDPPDQSPINGSFSMVFREPPIITEERISGTGIDEMLDTLVDSGAEIFFTVNGPVKRPHVQFDPKTSLNTLMGKSRR